MARGDRRPTVEAGGEDVIGIIGTIVLLPLALVGLAVGLVRFGLSAVRALVGSGISRLAASG